LKKLEYIIYHGDTITTASAAVASSKLLNPGKKYKSVHLEAGLRSWNNFEPFPEEISRRIVSRFSDVLLSVSEISTKNLKRLKKPKVLHFGNTIVDSANIALSLAKKRKVKVIDKGKFAIVTVHRYENLKSKKRMEKIIDILHLCPIPTYFYMHGNTVEALKKFRLMEKLKSGKNIHILEPSDYVDFIYQTSKCSIIICDGGSMQEESLVFGKPCIILRYSTERPEGLEHHFQFLSCPSRN